MGKPMSWKWKLAIGVVAFLLFGTGFIFTESGHQWMRDRIMNAYNELPDAEKRDSPLADKFLTLAYFRSNVTLDPKTGMEMYKEFCGFRCKPDRGTEYGMKVVQTGKLDGICSPDGKTGWGPMHMRAPEAFFNYIQLYDPTHSNQFTKAEIENYYRLFFLWPRIWGPDHKPHPLFMKYWPKLKEMGARTNFAWSDPSMVPTIDSAGLKYDPKTDPTVDK